MTLRLSYHKKGEFTVKDTGAEIIIKKGQGEISVSDWEEFELLRDLMHIALPRQRQGYSQEIV